MKKIIILCTILAIFGYIQISAADKKNEQNPLALLIQAEINRAAGRQSQQTIHEQEERYREARRGCSGCMGRLYGKHLITAAALPSLGMSLYGVIKLWPNGDRE